MLKHVKDAAFNVRGRAIQYLGRFTSEEAYEAVISALDDAEIQVVKSAIYALEAYPPADDSVAKLKAFAQHESAEVRGSAAHTLGIWGQSEALLKLLEDEEPRVRSHAADHIGLLRYEPAIPALVRALKDPGQRVRRAAAKTLGQIAHELAVKPLIEALTDSDSAVVQNVAWALGRFGDPEAILPLIEASSRMAGESEARKAIVTALGRFRTASVRALLKRLESQGPVAQREAAWLLGQLSSRLAVPALISATESPDAEVRSAAAEALAAIADPSAASALVSLLGDVQKAVRVAALEALARLPLREAPKEVVGIATDADDQLNHVATRVLVELQDPATVDVLRTLAKHDDPKVRREAVIGLAYLGDAAAAIMLERELDHARHTSRQRLTRALAALGTPEAARMICRIVKTDQPAVAKVALAALGSIASPDALDTLVASVRHSRFDLRQAAVDALAKQPAGAGVPALLKVFEDSHPGVIYQTRHALQLLSDRSVEPVREKLIAAIRSSDLHAWARAVSARHLRAYPSPESVQVLNSLLTDEAFRVRLEAIEALGWVGDSSHAGPLRGLAEDPDAEVRAAALTALGRLGDGDRESRHLFLAALKDPVAGVREAAASALSFVAEATDEAVIRALTVALGHQEIDVRKGAAFALGEIGGAAAAKVLWDATADPDFEIARAALQALADAEGKAALPELLAKVREGNLEVAKTAVTSLWRLGDASAIEPLMSLLDEATSLRRMATETLAWIHTRIGSEFPDALTRAVEEEVFRLRKRIRFHPDDAVARNRLAWLLAASRRDLDEALTHSLRARYLSPWNSAFVDTLAEVHRERGQLSEALAIRRLPLLRKSVSYSRRVNRQFIQELERQVEGAQSSK